VIPYLDGGGQPLHPWVEVMPAVEGPARQLTVHNTSDMAITWTFADGWTVAGTPIALEYPEAVVTAQGPDSSFAHVRLRADGSSAAIPLVSTEGIDGQPFIDAEGIVVLQGRADGYQVVRYPLPG
jgi:hypothetical protein